MSLCLQVEKEREEPNLMDLSEHAKLNPSLRTENISFKWAHQHGFSPFIKEGAIFYLSNTVHLLAAITEQQPKCQSCLWSYTITAEFVVYWLQKLQH
jgi:hypothetical protein